MVSSWSRFKLLTADPREYFFAVRAFAHEDELRVHHAARRGRIEGKQFAHFVGFLAGHLFQQLVRGLFRQVGQEVGGSVRGHFLENVCRFFWIQLLDDLRGQALIEFGEDGRSGLFVERSDNSLPLRRGQGFDDFGEIGGVEIFELFVSDAQFNATQRVGFDEVHEFPANGALGQLALQLANHSRRYDSLQEAADCAGQSDVDLGDAKFHVTVGLHFGQVHIVDANDLAAVACR